MYPRAVCIIVVLIFISSTLGFKETYFRRHATVDRLCSASGLVSFGTARSVLACGKVCDQAPGCVSYFYNRLDKTCRGSNLVHTDLTACDVIPGVALYEQDVLIEDPCLSDLNCPLPDTFCDVDSKCKCIASKRASLDLKVCLALCTNVPPTVLNGTVDPGNDIVEGTVKSYTCNQDNGVSPPGGPATTTCRADAKWSPLNFTCVWKECEVGWHRILDHCYYVETPYQDMQIDEARIYCYDKSAYVLQLETEAENIAVNQYLSTTFGIHNWWIGLTDEGNEDTWRWLETNVTTSWLNWNVGFEPDGGVNESYAVIWDTNMWADVPLPYNYYTPVCEKETEVIV